MAEDVAQATSEFDKDLEARRHCDDVHPEPGHVCERPPSCHREGIALPATQGSVIKL